MSSHQSNHTSEWIEASAGSGKTYQLIHRILGLLLKDTSFNDILCITFTNAAAGEMEKRLQEKLEHWALSSDMELEQDMNQMGFENPCSTILDKARNLYEDYLWSQQKIRFTTLHGMCQSMLRTFALESNVSPDFSVLEEREQAQLWHEAFEHVAQTSQTMGLLTDLVNHTSLPQLGDLLLDLLKNRYQWINLESLRGKTQENLSQVVSLCILKDESDPFMWLISQHPLQKISRLCEHCETGSASDQSLAQNLRRHYTRFSSDPNLESYQAVIDLFLTKTGQFRKKMVSKKTSDTLDQNGCDFSVFFNDLSSVHQKICAQNICEKTNLLLSLFTEIYIHYASLKNSQGLLDFDDLIIKTNQLLESPEQGAWVRYKLDNRLMHLLVDEAQDTSALQWQLLMNLLEDFFTKDNDPGMKSLFIVGDKKQSIYSFQGADLKHLDHYQTIVQERFSAHGHLIKKRILDHSYRSTKPILQFVDHIFNADQNPHGPFYQLSHKTQRHGLGGRVSLWPLEQNDDSINPNDVNQSAEKKVADKIAATISHWLKQGSCLLSKDRPIEPRDIMILLQKRGRFGPEMAAALKHHQIPCAGLDRLTLQDNLAVRDLQSLLKFLLLPDDDFSLAGILKSPLVNIDEQILSSLALSRQDRSLWQELQKQGKKEESLREIVCWLHHLLNKVDYVTPYSLVSMILIEQRGLDKWIADLGSSTADPLLEYLSMCELYEQKNGPSLEKWVHWFETNEIEIKRALSDPKQNYVRLMTVHGAKGLQAPIVFLPDTTENKNSRGPIYWHDGGMLWASSSLEKEISPIPTIKKQKQHLIDEESKRLLYVALTRAEEQLFIAGWSPSRGSMTEYSWYHQCQKALKELVGDNADLEKPLIFKDIPKHFTSALPLNNSKHDTTNPLPRWLSEPLASEEKSIEIIRPSNPEQESQTHHNEEALFYGSLMHKILEHLPSQSHWNAFLERAKIYIKASDDDLLSVSKKEKMEQELKNLLTSDVSYLFQKGALYQEPSFWSEVNGKLIKGQIDLILRNSERKEIWIIDYKTGKFNEKALEKYQKQLMIYGHFIQSQYPEDHVHIGVLWIESRKLSTFKLHS